ncbi:hypothetical protein AB833_29130 [Chromatiales bacterium (ex Bugula neritina AB1)]|nr:hypothetical protein AB833_29130 [Chromatiales bacterium (ex Bugula neritina AB1)]
MSNTNNSRQQSSNGLMPSYCPSIINQAKSHLLGDTPDTNAGDTSIYERDQQPETTKAIGKAAVKSFQALYNPHSMSS